ncbi:hypothetical protein M9H77_30138 [Catharanthus roseus]|uniref:Uncharacterized protein n=1 Tax=Catharanthus roseus TaxID=4058 RepID=A0ACC0A0B4_CATRO|nr:hypothetical protein M9H77_30138 [Catharanthus roseus]
MPSDQEVDDMASVVIQEPASSPSQMAVFAKKVQTIIRRCMVSTGRYEHVDPGHVEVERGEGCGGGQPPINPFDSSNLGIPSFSLGLTPPSYSLPSGSWTLQMPPPPSLGFAPFQSPHPISFGFSVFCVPLLRAQPVHLHRISLYRRHLHLMKRSGRMTRMLYNILDSDIVLVRRQRGSRHPTGCSCN